MAQNSALHQKFMPIKNFYIKFFSASFCSLRHHFQDISLKELLQKICKFNKGMKVDNLYKFSNNIVIFMAELVCIDLALISRVLL